MVFLGIFEPTFGGSLQKLNFSRVSFLGPILQTVDFLPSHANYYTSLDKNIGKKSFIKLSKFIKREENNFSTVRYKPIKPPAVVTLNKEKVFFLSRFDERYFIKRKKEPTIVFHPPLPYSFLLYFQDRQIAHIEFMFYISGNGKISSLKRKVSSGNLDADLLSLRYIAHCLNLVEGKFPSDSWQTVEIDLTRKND